MDTKRVGIKRRQDWIIDDKSVLESSKILDNKASEKCGWNMLMVMLSYYIPPGGPPGIIPGGLPGAPGGRGGGAPGGRCGSPMVLADAAKQEERNNTTSKKKFVTIKIRTVSK